MVIKHWQGYGKVTAKKISKNTKTQEYTDILVTTLVVELSGNHEWGLERNSTYDVWGWLVKKFDKSVGDYFDYVVSMEMEDSYDNMDVEHCKYTIKYYKK